MQPTFGNYRIQMVREMDSADNLWARANSLRIAGRIADAENLEHQAERIDSRHENRNFSSWLHGRYEER